MGTPENSSQPTKAQIRSHVASTIAVGKLPPPMRTALARILGCKGPTTEELAVEVLCATEARFAALADTQGLLAASDVELAIAAMEMGAARVKAALEILEMLGEEGAKTKQTADAKVALHTVTVIAKLRPEVRTAVTTLGGLRR